MKIIERNVQEIGKSFLVTLPKEWAKALHIRKGTKLKMIVSEEGHLSIAPEFAKSKERKEAVIPLDKDFNRRFFREYFDGAEKITVKKERKTQEKTKKHLYEFLKRFMNVQIINENQSEIVIKCFKIDELSMDECLRRMYFLSLNIFDEISTKTSKSKINEIKDSMTRFYYLLVMQVRRFLSEGKFTKDNQIPLIRAMDIRMVAEKIQRIARCLELIGLSEKQKEIEKVREYYKKAFGCFINQKFEDAVPLSNVGASLEQTYRKRHKKKSFNKVGNLIQIIRYSKEISMLVR